VVAAAVILDPDRVVPGLDDSKKLAAPRREMLAGEIRSASLAWSVAWADTAEIDALNILEATMLAMRRAVLGLPVAPTRLLVDGNREPGACLAGRPVAARAIVRGDQRVAAISAASILAKTFRDRVMREIDGLYPGYGFARHKGYGTELHRDRLLALGPCAQHRRSFAPVRLAG
jgi:ribonuclease HII